MKITISVSLYKKIRKFAEEVTKTTANIYAARGQCNYAKLIDDHCRGKTAEFATWAWLKKQGVILPKPDLTIHKKKSHSADLGSEYHIKSVAPNKTNSWVYQKNCKYLYSGTHVLTISDGRTTEILGVINGEHLKDQYEDLQLDYLNKTKTCLYWDTLKKIRKREFVYKCPNEN